MSFGEFYKRLKYERDIELIVQWNPNPQANLKTLESNEFQTINLSQSQNVPSNKGVISLHDCLTWFSQEETLTGNDKWYCSNCKTHQNALKKMEIFKSPDYLIIHLKRFSHQRTSFFGSRKISELVDFPIENLDLKSYVIPGKE